MANAKKKLDRKHLDLIVANDVGQPGAGFDVDTNVVKILDARGGVEELPAPVEARGCGPRAGSGRGVVGEAALTNGG